MWSALYPISNHSSIRQLQFATHAFSEQVFTASSPDKYMSMFSTSSSTGTSESPSFLVTAFRIQVNASNNVKIL